MSRPKNDYYGYIMMRIKKYPGIKEEDGIVPMLQWNAIEKELAKLDNEKDKDKLRAIKMVLIDKTHTYEGAAQVLHYSYPTIKLWIQNFVNAVGKNSGF